MTYHLPEKTKEHVREAGRWLFILALSSIACVALLLVLLYIQTR